MPGAGNSILDVTGQASAARSTTLIGVLCGTCAALGWAAGFAAAKHGVNIGFSPPEIAFHRFFWSGLLLIPIAMRQGIVHLGGIGWRHGLILMLLAGPVQAVMAYTGFTLVPLGHGATIQPACAALFGITLAALWLREPVKLSRMIGGAAIIVGLLVFGAESITTFGRTGVGGDLLFVGAGLFWATFGTLLRRWHVSGTRAAAIVGTLAVIVFAPLFAAFIGFDGLLHMSLKENLIQIVVQGLLAGVLPIFLFARAVMLLGAGRAAVFPALVPGFSLIIGYLALGIVPSVLQLVGLAVVLVGFRFALR